MLMAQSRLIQILLLTTAYMLGICSLLSGEMSTCAAVSMSFQCRPNPSKVIWENYLRGVSSELKVQTSVWYDMVLERESTQPFLTRDN